jgi:dihydrodipicolinate synthase/N-acetylneuraminate lyase
MPPKLEGLLPAFITAFTAQGRVDPGAAAPLVDYYLEQGADGLYALGWTGEGWCMTPDERKTWAEAALSAARGRLPVVIHVGYCPDTADAAALARHAADHRAFAVASVPLAGNNSLRANTDYFRQLADAAGLPFYIYWNQEIVDDRTGARAHPKVLLDAMAAIPGFAGIKYTDTNFYYIDRLKKYNPAVNILTGADGMCIAGGLLRADGSIGALQAVTCRHMKTLYLAMKASRIAESMDLQTRANNVYEMLDRPDIGVIQGLKAILLHQGLPAGYPKPPVKPLTDPRLLAELLQVHKANILA